jgi:quinol monooxygenase YgiN
VDKKFYKNQPGVVLKLKANPGMGNALLELVHNLHFTGDPDGPVDWVICKPSDEEPDTLWVFEFYRDEESFTRHYSDPAIDEVHNKMGELLEDMQYQMREDINIYSSSQSER